MKKFYNRKNELAFLNKHFIIAKNNLITEAISGRRRIGKTELIKKYIENKPSLYFYVTKKSSQMILNDFSVVLQERFSFLPKEIRSWEDFFNIIFELSKKQRLIVVFDEFQNFCFTDNSVFSILQKKIDEFKKHVKMHLIFIGSIQSLMDKIFTQKEPLFGRIDNFIYLSGFDFNEIAAICKDHNIKQINKIFNLYSIFNGVAKYYDVLEKFNLFTASKEKILKELFITKDSALYKEGENLLIEEFGPNHKRYFDILFCLSIGKTKTNEIANIMQLPVTTISKYLSVLIQKYKIVEKRNWANKFNSKNNRYYLKDYFLQFWFRYVYKNYNKIELGAVKSILSDFNISFQSHQGFIFEELTRKMLLKKILEENILKCNPSSITNYWDKHNEFDIYWEDKNSLLIGEIKLNSKAVNVKLINKINSFTNLKQKDIIKVIVAFDAIHSKPVMNLLKKYNFHFFSLEDLR